jgi:helix-turn-helix protein
MRVNDNISQLIEEIMKELSKSNNDVQPSEELGSEVDVSLIDAAEYLGYEPKYMYQLNYNNKIPYYRPNNGKVRYKVRDLNEFKGRNRNLTYNEFVSESTKKR